MDAPVGLSSAEVAARVRAGRVNTPPDAPVRSTAQILRSNLVQPVNLLIYSLVALVLVFKPGADALLGATVTANIVVGVVQELRARAAVRDLRVLVAPQARVRRDGTVGRIDAETVVEGDLVGLRSGDQVPVDGEIVVSDGLELDEALLTGESEPVARKPGEAVRSGSVVVAGDGWIRATAVGAEAYANALTVAAQRSSSVRSDLRDGVNRVMRWLLIAAVPLFVVVLSALLSHQDDTADAVAGTVAAVVNVVPDGLVLMTSVSFRASVVTLARAGVLARELAAVEVLARIDVVCLDKTGTITTGAIGLREIRPLDQVPRAEVDAALASMVAADEHPNASLAAIGSGVGPVPDGWATEAHRPFSSARGWSAIAVAGRGTWVLGAAERVLRADDPALLDEVAGEAGAGRRVLVLARTERPLGEELPGGLSAAALVLLGDELRNDAAEIVAWLGEQGADLKVISGDHPATVAAVARSVGLVDERPVDASDLAALDDATVDRLVAERRVFGRVAPAAKQRIVERLQAAGRTVAMTGDGVNDVLAVKRADLGIAIGDATDATRAVADLTIVGDRFSVFPAMMREARRVLHDVERVAGLYLAKSTVALVLAVAAAASRLEYPLLPRHLSLLSTFIIGLPGLYLALQPSTRRSAPGFLGRALRFAAPAGVTVGLATLVTFAVLRSQLPLDEARTGATLTLLGGSLLVLARILRPIRATRALLLAALVGGYLAAIAIPFTRSFYDLAPPPASWWPLIAAAVSTVAAVLWTGPRLVPSWAAADHAMSADTEPMGTGRSNESRSASPNPLHTP
ncbi:MAG: HAD-IC family P-type ATPase [Actinomycetota bacterium]|nr:HAD-IC family P-type ATPase [Actinomycetota bacterium]